jgi:hypothetical protein
MVKIPNALLENLFFRQKKTLWTPFHHEGPIFFKHILTRKLICAIELLYHLSVT